MLKILQTEVRSDPAIRWWPLRLIAGLAVGAVTINWFLDLPLVDTKIFLTVAIMISASGLVVLWALFLSGARWKMRLLITGAIVAVITAAVAQIRVSGDSGDSWPILEWRFAQAAALLPALQVGPAVRPAASNHASPSRPYAQFLGPERNATLTGVALNPNWSTHPPKPLWRRPVGEGWSAFAITGGFAITQEQREDSELVVAYDLLTGTVRWLHADDVAKRGFASGGPGPRATPTIDGQRVFTVGATGMLNCLELGTGARIWSKDMIQENQAVVKYWGVSGSPVILDSLVVVSAGGSDGNSLVAYHREDGRLIWHAGSDKTGYSSPQIATLAGQKQILIFNHKILVSHRPETGAVLWLHPWARSGIAQPLVLPDNQILLSSGYGVGSELLQIRDDDSGGLAPESFWKTKNLKSKFANVVYHQGYLYGLDNGILVCLDSKTGERAWKRGRYGHGQLILADDLLLIQAESGDVVLVSASPTAHQELARFPALSSKTWNHPALAMPYLLVRNDREAACYKLARL